MTVINMQSEKPEKHVLYKSGDLRRISSKEPTSPHWYSFDDFKRLLYLHGVQNDMPLGQFVRMFRGLKTSNKAKLVTVGVGAVSSIMTDDDSVRHLYDRMREHSKAVNPKALGLIGHVKLLAKIEGVTRHWYRKCHEESDGVPFAFEILIVECTLSGLISCVNHSVSYGDFLEGNRIEAGELYCEGVDAVIGECDADECLIVVHLIGIGLSFLDRGKTRLDLPSWMLEPISKQIWSAFKTLHKEAKARIRKYNHLDRQAQQQEREQNQAAMNIKEGFVLVIDDAIQKATDNEALPANVRNLYYKCRDLIQDYTDKTLTYAWFNELLVTHWLEYGRHPLIYSDPRGVLYEPHTDVEIPLGTQKISIYNLPQYQFNKILYIEKKGLWPTIEASKLAKKYDMAVIAAEGYATEAARVLMKKAEDENYTIFILHDCDPDGLNIARTIQEETRRMPDHNLKAVDIGLHLETAIEMGLSAETFSRHKALNSNLDLSKIEREYFGGEAVIKWRRGKQKTEWQGCKRIELNAMSAGQMVSYIDQQLDNHLNGTVKVIPPTEHLAERAQIKLADGLEAIVDDHFRSMIDPIKEAIVSRFKLPSGQDFCIESYLREHQHNTWKDGAQDFVNKRINNLKSEYDFEEIISELNGHF